MCFGYFPIQFIKFIRPLATEEMRASQGDLRHGYSLKSQKARAREHMAAEEGQKPSTLNS
jgi:hypothetical protein